MQKTNKDYLFVGVQVLLFLLYLLIPHWSLTLLPAVLRYLGLAMALLGGVVIILALLHLGESLTVYPTPKSDSSLKTHGLYRWTRHPIYSGIIFAGLGWGVFQQNFAQIAIAGGLWVLFFFKSSYEEKGLGQRYGEAYQLYKQSVGRFFPKFW